MIKPKLKVYLAEDHSVVRKGMQRLLNSFEQVDCVKDAANGKELLTLIEEDHPDAVILDVEMPIMGGIEAAKIIADRYPMVKMLVLTMHNEAVFINKLMDIGVHGFLSKSAEPQEVEKALRAIVEKDFYKNDIATKALLSINGKTTEAKYCKLTNREVEILLLICQELTPGEISERLQISEKTFFNHRANILEKTKARSNVGLIRYAILNGYFKI
ncbi:MAG: response regulator transcription factor [Bacteroidetes bacterium]|nr:response regulator transcription factor [Bacteroidota bacterium]MBI3483280.1 response regulator transcription factor [Bacteroidota bacterium]